MGVMGQKMALSLAKCEEDEDGRSSASWWDARATPPPLPLLAFKPVSKVIDQDSHLTFQLSRLKESSVLVLHILASFKVKDSNSLK